MKNSPAFQNIEPRIHPEWCKCRDCTPRLIGEKLTWLPSTWTGALCLAIAVVGIIIHHNIFN